VYAHALERTAPVPVPCSSKHTGGYYFVQYVKFCPCRTSSVQWDSSTCTAYHTSPPVPCLKSDHRGPQDLRRRTGSTCTAYHTSPPVPCFKSDHRGPQDLRRRTEIIPVKDSHTRIEARSCLLLLLIAVRINTVTANGTPGTHELPTFARGMPFLLLYVDIS
jgi:hypothetical protein